MSASVCVIFLLIHSHHRFEFDVTLAEAQTRKLDVAVKNDKMFHMRQRKDIGMVGNAIYDKPCTFLTHLFKRLFVIFHYDLVL